MSNQNNQNEQRTIRETVRTAYGTIAKQGGSCCASASCCGQPSADKMATGIGYREEELGGLPAGANMGLSCGNPTAIASLRPGEIVLDLGAGGGFDAFIAARQVGATGRVIGVDMTPEMVNKARGNAETFTDFYGLDNVEFRLGEIEHLPVADASVDVVISNCVLNLSPDKAQVWREISRVLKPGGRVSISDLALLQPLPPALKESIEALVGCVAGAVLVDQTREHVKAAGLIDGRYETKADYMEQMAQWSDPFYRELAEKLPSGARPSEFVTSLTVTASKPGQQER